jgi:FtsZ-binding cell division protein ZapB
MSNFEKFGLLMFAIGAIFAIELLKDKANHFKDEIQRLREQVSELQRAAIRAAREGQG